MISIQAAWNLIEDSVALGPTQTIGLMNALGNVLAEDIQCTVNSPPFDKSMMDGFGIKSTDFANGLRTYRIAGELMAGHTSQHVLQSGEAIQIMTGAPIPAGVDAVIQIEETQQTGSNVEITTDRSIEPHHNIVKCGESMRVGETLMTSGKQLQPQDIGLLAELGRHEIQVRRPPTIAVLATGDELVPVDVEPGAGQIRNSNEPMLAAQITRAGCQAVPLGIAHDNPKDLHTKITRGLDADFLCLSGGVSAGKKDLVPSELARAGVVEVFHKVALKPGKPIWFGVLKGERPRYVFGLPGNPVSSFVCFELFVKAAIRRWIGLGDSTPRLKKAKLSQPFRMESNRPTLFPSMVFRNGSEVWVTPSLWKGSFDLRATIESNALAYFHEAHEYQTGDDIEVLHLH
ncbi:MAG: molybdopterin molybdotransferase MoeA [Planctomycetaceae bacterium]